MTGAGACSTSFTPLTRATYQVQVRDRVTGEVRCTFEEGTGSFTRKLDGQSSAEWIVTVLGGDDEDCDQPEGGPCSECEVRERKDELAFVRDDWEEPAWIGPILRTVDDPQQGTIRYNAVDRTYWWQGAPASTQILREAPNEIDVIDMGARLLAMADEYSPANLQWFFKETRLPPTPGLDVEIKLKEGESVWAQIISKAKSVLDYTVVGEQFYWGSPEIPVDEGPTILPVHFQSKPILDRDAEGVVTQVRVTGAGGVLGIYPEEEVDLGYGRRTEFVSDTNLNTQAEADARAREVYEANTVPTTFVITGQGSLSDEFPLPLHELIPGRKFLVFASGQCLESTGEDLVQMTGLAVELGTEAAPDKRIVERTVAADFGAVGTTGKAERQSA